MGMQSIHGNEIAAALQRNYRVYLCGDKSMIQPELAYLPDEQLEIGISDYAEYTADLPHVHTRNHEYNFVVCGCTKVLELDTGEEREFEAGSLYVFSPNTRHVCKHTAGTKEFFVKCPKGNDKMPVEVTEAIAEWMRAWDADYKQI